MDKSGAIYAFINYKQAAGFGHIGWGFSLGDGSYFFGSTDHLWKNDWWDLAAWWRYMHVPPSGDIDWWAEQGSKEDMLRIMGRGPHIHYHAYKEEEVLQSTPGNAIEKANELKLGGWDLSRHNCVHQTFLIFQSYSNGCSWPSPFANPLYRFPKYWFARMPGRQHLLRL